MARNTPQFRSVADVYGEMRDEWERYGIRDFALYSGFLLWRVEHNFIPLRDRVAATRDPFFRPCAPEGLDARPLSQSQKLADPLKAAHFQKIHLPCESIDDEYVRTLNRKHVRLAVSVRAAQMCETAGVSLRNLDVNAFALYGLPGESVYRVVKTVLFVLEIVGSTIPMLFTPVPSTRLYQELLPDIQARGWDRDLHMLNGKLFPFLEMNEGSVSDYIDMQRLMFTLNAHYRDQSFRIFGKTRLPAALRGNVGNGFGDFIAQYQDLEGYQMPGAIPLQLLEPLDLVSRGGDQG